MASCISDTGEADHAAFSLPVTRLVELPDTFKAIAAGSHDPENAVRWQRISGPALRTKGAYLHEYGSWLFGASEPTALAPTSSNLFPAREQMPQPIILSETPSQTVVTLLQRFQGLSMSTNYQ
jgi:hypothetical protein